MRIDRERDVQQEPLTEMIFVDLAIAVVHIIVIHHSQRYYIVFGADEL